MIRCPICENTVIIKKLSCNQCKIAFEGSFTLPRIARLNKDMIKLAEHFILSGGNLKTMAERLNISYPTLRKRIDELTTALENLYKEDEKNIEQILSKIENGQIPYEEAMRHIKEINNEL